MLDVRNVPPQTILQPWANHDGRDTWEQLAGFLNRLGYRVFPRNSPVGRLVAKDDVRRLVLNKLVITYPAYPVGRPPTPDDYDKIKIQILTETSGEIA